MWLLLGRHEEAATAFRAVLDARPKAVPAQVGLGRALTSLGKLDDAGEVLARALAKEGAEAIVQYQKALEVDDTFIDAHKNLAILCHTLSHTYQDRERTLLALEHYERYFALGGADKKLRQMHTTLLQFKDQILGN